MTIQKHRISTEIGRDQKVVIELKSTWDLLEILSLKFTQTDAYTSMCSDYGVVCGRISVNNGFGVPNARVSIFIPLATEDIDDPVISALYPFTSISDVNADGYKYNLLPSRKQHGGHEPTGTFPDQLDVLTREEVLEVYEKYYKLTVKTNNAGDFMIWGVPIGTQTIHVDVDLSDIGCFSLRPDDFIRQGKGVDNFKNTYSYKSSTDFYSLPQIVSFDKTIDVFPFWGNESFCEIGITRTDFDLSDKGVKIEPKAYVLGSVFSDSGKKFVNKRCVPRGTIGEKCGLTSGPAVIEIIRFTPYKDSSHRPILEYYEVNEDIGDDGAFVLPLPMNMDYEFTNEFGENEYTNDPNKGIPTSGVYRFRITMKNTDSGTASYLVPNIREFPSGGDPNSDEQEKSYAFSTEWSNYPTAALNDTILFNNIEGSYYPQDYFHRLTYNKVFGVSSFLGSYFGNGFFNFNRHTYLGIKEIAPKSEDDCESSILTPPNNWGIENTNFSIILAMIINIFERVIYTVLMYTMELVIWPFSAIADFGFTIDVKVLYYSWYPFGGLNDMVVYPLQRLGTLNLGIVTYPECEICDKIESPTTYQPPGNGSDPNISYQKVGNGIAIRDDVLVPYDTNSYDFTVISGTPVTFSYIDCSGNTSGNTLSSGTTISVPCIISGSALMSGGSGGLVTSTGSPGSVIIHYLPGGYDPNPAPTRDLLFTDLNSGYTYISGVTITGVTTGKTFSDIITDLSSDPKRYIVKLTSYLSYPFVPPITSPLNTTRYLSLITYSGGTYYEEIEVSDTSPSWLDYSTSWSGITYDIYDTHQTKPPATPVGSALQEGCSQYNRIFDSSMLGGGAGYVPGSEPYTTIYNVNSDKCHDCSTHSGFSEFQSGRFTIIPAASSGNWFSNASAIAEYARRKLVGKLFCEGIVDHSFHDNWLTGGLYMFPFKSKVTWDNESVLDISDYWTSYCSDLLYYKVKDGPFLGTDKNSPTYLNNVVPDKRFYYKSSNFNGTNFNRDRGTLGHPTTLVDLGPRDEFIKEICIDSSLDPNCSVVRNIGATSRKDFKEMLGLYINYKMETHGSPQSGNTYNQFFNNTGFNNVIPSKMLTHIFNGDFLQLESINNEAGIHGFNLTDKRYSAYDPRVINSIDNSDILDGGPMAINLVLDENNGYRVRNCINEPGNLTETSQVVPFYLWEKNGTGFGPNTTTGKTSQSWDYTSIPTGSLQGMTYNYGFSGNPSHNYTLFPMTKDYNFTLSDPLKHLLTKGTGESIDTIFNQIIWSTGSTATYTEHHFYDTEYEGYSFLYITGFTTSGTTTITPTADTGILYVRVGGTGYTTGWVTLPWSALNDFYIKPTLSNYHGTGTKQILSTPFLYYFGLRPGKTAVDKFMERFGPLGAFPPVN